MKLRDFFLFFIAKKLKMKLMFVLSIVVYVTFLLVADSVTRASKSDNTGINFLIIFYLVNYGNNRLF